MDLYCAFFEEAWAANNACSVAVSGSPGRASEGLGEGWLPNGGMAVGEAA
jgi:hypothetical protein